VNSKSQHSAVISGGKTHFLRPCHDEEQSATPGIGEFLRLKQFAQLTGLSRTTIWRLREKGELDVRQVSARTVLIPVEAAKKFLAKPAPPTVPPDRHSLVGKRFGHLVVESYTGRMDNLNALIWVARCDCGKHIETIGWYLKNGYKTDCGCKIRASVPKPEKPKAARMAGEISVRYWRTITCGAEARGLELTVTPEQAWQVVLKQERKCALSGRPLSFQRPGQTASLDRIDSSKGYTPGNIQWLDKEVNKAKMSLSQVDFINLCNDVTANQTRVAVYPGVTTTGTSKEV
jgi:hypothetical protein